MSERSDTFWKTQRDEFEKIEIKRTQWYKHLILVSSSLFGILISLRPEPKNIDHISILYYLTGLSLLALCILFLSITIYGNINTDSRAILEYNQKATNAINKGTKIPNIQVTPRRIFIISEYSGYIAFVLSIILLSCYLWSSYF